MKQREVTVSRLLPGSAKKWDTHALHYYFKTQRTFVIIETPGEQLSSELEF